jgi:hypothetical protein
MRWVARFVWAGWSLLAVAQSASAQILGRVVDRATRNGVAEASVLLLTEAGDPVGQTLTDSLGVFMFIHVTDSATYTLQVMADGTVGDPVDPIEYRGEAAHRIVILDSRGALERPVSIGPPPEWRERFCTPSIWVNGQPDWRLNDMIRDGEGFSRMAGRSVNDFLPGKDEIIGIEVYRSRRSVPRELQIEAERLGGTLFRECGIILIWTR